VSLDEPDLWKGIGTNIYHFQNDVLEWDTKGGCIITQNVVGVYKHQPLKLEFN
jgi:hypothetical protein